MTRYFKGMVVERPDYTADVLLLIAIAAAMAFFFVGGVSNDDLLKVYAATLRIVAGQLPYRDFFPQNAPLANVLAAPAFAVLPTIGTAALALAVTLNVAATLLMHRFILRLTGQRVPALVAGVLMAVWYCQIGGYYFDQVTYLLGFAAFARYAERPDGAGAGATEGLLLACAGLAKQTVGAFVLAAFVATVLLFDGWKPLLRPRFLAAFAAPLLAFCAYLTVIGGWQQFYTYAIVQPAEYGSRGYESNPWRLATDFVQPWGLDIVAIVRDGRLGQLAFFPIVLSVYLSYVIVALGVRRGHVDRRVAAGYVFLLLSTVWAAATPGRLYTHITFGVPGIVALTIYVLAALSSGTARVQVGRWAALAAVALFGGIALVQAAYNLYPDGRQASPLARGDLWPLTFDGRQVEAIRVAATIESERKTYALFGEGYLNAAPLALGRAPVDPVLFYEHGVTIPFGEEQRRAWEATVIAHLRVRQPDVLLVGFYSADQPRHTTSILSMDGLPALEAYFKQTYSQVLERSGTVTLFARDDAAR